MEKRELVKAWQDNRDGAGYMFAVDGRLVVRKPFWKLKAFRKAYKADFARYGAESPFVLHFRYATHGPKTERNTHPHILAGGAVGMVHNGVLPWIPADPNLSDTAFFADELQAYKPDDLMNPEFHGMLETDIGWNKLVFLDGAGQYGIVNADCGHWEGERWLSSPGWSGFSVKSRDFRQKEWSFEKDREDLEYYYGLEEELELESAWDRHMAEEEALKKEWT